MNHPEHALSIHPQASKQVSKAESKTFPEPRDSPSRD